MVDLPDALRHPVVGIQNPYNESVEFALLEVDREALKRDVESKR
jgi:hypothetical protein